VHESEHQYNHHKFNSKYRFLPQKAHPSFAKEPPIFVLAKEPPFPLQKSLPFFRKEPPSLLQKSPPEKGKEPYRFKGEDEFLLLIATKGVYAT